MGRRAISALPVITVQSNRADPLPVLSTLSEGVQEALWSLMLQMVVRLVQAVNNVMQED